MEQKSDAVQMQSTPSLTPYDRSGTDPVRQVSRYNLACKRREFG